MTGPPTRAGEVGVGVDGFTVGTDAVAVGADDAEGTTLASMTFPGPGGPPMPYPVTPGPEGAPAVYPAPYGVPAPPPGPGVTPPFAAPPTEGRTMRMWIGLGVAGLAVLLCCGGGVAAVVGLTVAGTEAINEQARAVAGDYFEAVSNEEYDKAYDFLCDAAQRRESPREFEERVSEEPEIDSFLIGEVTVVSDLIVPVGVTYAGGGRDDLQVRLAQDGRTGALEICGIT